MNKLTVQDVAVLDIRARELGYNNWRDFKDHNHTACMWKEFSIGIPVLVRLIEKYKYYKLVEEEMKRIEKKYMGLSKE